jgi:hypothetical protein
VTSDPTRLTVVGATDLERTLLQAARNERPSPELSARMAAGLGISVGAALTTAAAPAAAAAPAVAAATKTATLSAVSGWVSAGVLAVAVTAGVAGVRMSHVPAPAPSAVAPAATLQIAPPVADPPRAQPVVAVPGPRSEKIRRRPSAPAVAPAPASDLRDQIALIDAARGAVKVGASDRALVLLRRYDASYPGGAFEPEALALRVEALDQASRHAEARTLGRDFLARYPRSPLADRVARVVQN